MTLAVPSTTTDNMSFLSRHAAALQALTIIVIGLLFAAIFDWAREWPVEWAIPFKAWISDFFRWLDKEASLGLFTVKAWPLYCKRRYAHGFLGIKTTAHLVRVLVMEGCKTRRFHARVLAFGNRHHMGCCETVSQCENSALGCRQHSRPCHP